MGSSEARRGLSSSTEHAPTTAMRRPRPAGKFRGDFMGGTQSEEIVAEMLAQRNEVARAPQWGRPRLSHARAGRAGGGAGPKPTVACRLSGLTPLPPRTAFAAAQSAGRQGREKGRAVTRRSPLLLVRRGSSGASHMDMACGRSRPSPLRPTTCLAALSPRFHSV